MLSNPKAIKYYFFLTLMMTCIFFTALLLGEILIRLVTPQDLSGSWKEITDWGYYVNKANTRVRHQFKNRVVYYRFNEHHLRGEPVKHNIPKILVLGDSYTFGFLLEEKATIVRQLQSHADSVQCGLKIQFLNGGVSGWSTATYLAFLEQFGDSIVPEIILVFLNTDDIGRSIKNQIYLLQNHETLELKLHKNQLKIGQYKRFFNKIPVYQWLLEHSHLIQFLRVRFMTYFQNKYADSRFKEMLIPSSSELRIEPQLAQAYGRALFRRMKKWCDQRKVKLFITTTGFHFLHNDKDTLTEPTAVFMSKAPAIFSEEGIPFYDISKNIESVISDKLEEYIIAGDGHPNEAANSLIAQIVWEWLHPQLCAIQR